MRKSKNKTKIKSLFIFILFVILLIYVISLLIPIFWGILTSLKNDLFDFSNNVLGFPKFSAWDKGAPGDDVWYANYINVFKNFEFVLKKSYYVGLNSEKLVNSKSNITITTALINTMLYTIPMSFLNAIVPCIVAYLCVKYRNPFSRLVYVIVVITMALPLFGQAPSLIVLLRKLNLYDRFLGQWLLSASFNTLYFLVFYAFFEGLSDAYIEAAEIDGASQLQVLVKIVLPLAKNTLLTVMLIVFVALWNDYNAPMLYLPTKPTLAFGVFWLQQHNPVIKGSRPLQVTSLMILALPILILFIIFKDKFMGNISLGGVKE